MSSKELELCPFCGKAPRREGTQEIVCDSDERCNARVWATDLLSAEEIWNHRAKSAEDKPVAIHPDVAFSRRVWGCWREALRQYRNEKS